MFNLLSFFNPLYSKEISYETNSEIVKLNSSRDFINDGKKYDLIENLNAYLSLDTNSFSIKLSGEFIEKKGGYVIFNLSGIERLANENVISNNTKKYLVVYNVHKKILGIIVCDVLVSVDDVSIADN